MSDLLGESHHLEAEDEITETPNELVITEPRNQFKVFNRDGRPVVVVIPEKDK